MNFNIIFIDDTLRRKDPLILRHEQVFPDTNIQLFPTIDEGKKYIFEHDHERNIVFLDCKFDSIDSGGKLLKEIREKNNLISIVMMSANSIGQFSDNMVLSMINLYDVHFIKNNKVKEAVELTKRIVDEWKRRFDCVFEEWLTRNIQENRGDIKVNIGDRKYSYADLLIEVRKRTEIGLHFERMMLEYGVFLYTKENEER